MSRKDWKLEPVITFEWTNDEITILPTIIYYPWKQRYPGFPAMVLTWLGFQMSIGYWKNIHDN